MTKLMTNPSHRLTFTGSQGEPLAARLDLPPTTPRAFALFDFPQAFSHIGLVNAAWAIDQAERQAGDHQDGMVSAR